MRGKLLPIQSPTQTTPLWQRLSNVGQRISLRDFFPEFMRLQKRLTTASAALFGTPQTTPARLREWQLSQTELSGWRICLLRAVTASTAYRLFTRKFSKTVCLKIFILSHPINLKMSLTALPTDVGFANRIPSLQNISPSL